MQRLFVFHILLLLGRTAYKASFFRCSVFFRNILHKAHLGRGCFTPAYTFSLDLYDELTKTAVKNCAFNQNEENKLEYT